MQYVNIHAMIKNRGVVSGSDAVSYSQQRSLTNLWSLFYAKVFAKKLQRDLNYMH